MAAITNKTQFLLSLSFLRGVGPAALKRISKVENFERIGIDGLWDFIPALERALREPFAWERAQELASIQIAQAEKINARIISGLDSDYPSLLASAKDDPFILFLQGKLAPNPHRAVAIIGTRKPTDNGVKVAARITTHMAEQGWSIVSGLAIGCDSVAHQKALDLNAHTVAVMAHGLHTVAPARHKRLAAEIVEKGGALISEYRFGQDVQNAQYVKRDKTQAGLAQGVVMIQSDTVGGSLHASRASINYGRWLAVPYPTEIDRENCEPKIQANLVLADGTHEEKCKLLHCSPNQLSQIIIIRDKRDYQLLDPEPRQSREAAPKNSATHLPSISEPPKKIDSGLSVSIDLEEIIPARINYIRSKILELKPLLEIFPDSSVETKLEVQFFFEEIFNQFLRLLEELDTRDFRRSPSNDYVNPDRTTAFEILQFGRKAILDQGRLALEKNSERSSAALNGAFLSRLKAILEKISHPEN